ncbi:MAG: hypothetical protein HY535_05250 [Chloroflexi bacterium]|nr:hypothetical protein [Chloroflexota bacterium]
MGVEGLPGSKARHVTTSLAVHQEDGIPFLEKVTTNTVPFSHAAIVRQKPLEDKPRSSRGPDRASDPGWPPRAHSSTLKGLYADVTMRRTHGIATSGLLTSPATPPARADEEE